MLHKVWSLTVLTAMFASGSPAQHEFAKTLANQVRADIAVLSAGPTLAAWQRSHPGGKVELAHYETDKGSYAVEWTRLNRWCAASVSNATVQVIRTTLFYLPSVRLGALPSLPEKEDRTMTRACRMQAIWYSIHAEISIDSLVEELSSLWGRPKGQSKADISGSGQWRGATWRQRGMNIWAVYDVVYKPNGVVMPRLVVYARRDMRRDPDVFGWYPSLAIENQVIDAAAQMATRDSALTAAVLSRSHCHAVVLKREANSLTLNRLSQWLNGSADWPSQRRAAILLVADAYLDCVTLGYSQRLVQLGAKFKTNCPQDGPVYSGNFRDQAEKLDSRGPAGELAALAGLAAPCSLKGHHPWPDLLIERAGRLLNEFPRDQWTPWMLYAIASAHAAKLSFAYPGGDPEGEIFSLTAAAMQQEQKAAIEYFEQFIREKPDAPESVFAWQEAWRLLAGLPPSRVTFGCGCE